ARKPRQRRAAERAARLAGNRATATPEPRDHTERECSTDRLDGIARDLLLRAEPMPGILVALLEHLHAREKRLLRALHSLVCFLDAGIHDVVGRHAGELSNSR